MKKALVLGGGGAKGSYQIGVWKALRRLHIKFDIVTGVSIGALNGGFYASKQYGLAKRMWLTVKTSDFFDYDIGGKKLTAQEALGLFEQIIRHGGMSFDKAEDYLKKYLKEEAIRNSNIDYGLLTVSLTTKKPRELTKDEIPKGKLLDYMCASSICYPAVAKKEIDGEYFIDGGFYDGLPINLAIDMGAEEILAIDLSVFGLKKDPKNKNIKIETIKMKDNTPLTLSFTKEYALKNISLGYNDAMKHYNKLDGNLYTFRKNDLSKNYNKISKKFVSLLKNILLEETKNKIIKELFSLGNFNKLFKNIKDSKSIDKEVNEAIEYLGKLFNLPNEKIYSINHFNRLLVCQVEELNYIKINKNLKGKFLISYVYNKYLNTDNKNKLNHELFNIALLFPKDFLAAMYLISLTKKYELLLKTEELYDEILDYIK